MENSVKDKTVLVTGGAMGLGLAMVDKFLEHSAKIVIIVDIDEEAGIKAAEKITKKYGIDRAVFVECDVISDLNETFEIILTKYRYVDVLVNNAGLMNEKSIKNTINVNLIALMEWTIKFYDYMRSDRGGDGGTIINVASVYGLRITPFGPFYIASKFGVVGFTRSIGHEYNYKKSNVRVVAMCPGFTFTHLTATICLRDDDMLEDCVKDAKTYQWQEVDAVGKGAIDIFEKAESGTVWVIEGSQPAVMV